MPQKLAKESETSQLPLLEFLQKHQANNHTIHAEDLSLAHSGSVTVTSVSVSPYVSFLGDSVYCALFTCLTPLNPKCLHTPLL